MARGVGKFGFGVALAAVAGGAHAQETALAEGPAQLEEIVVTAQRRSESLQQVPIAASVLDSDRLDRAGVRDLDDLTRVVPNVNFTGPFGASSPQATIRGVGVSVFTQNTEGAVALYADEVYLNNPAVQTLNAFDLERVEVLRGPQGTLYGRNATGGVLNFISRKPEFDSNGFVNLSYGRFDTIDATAGGEVALAPTLGLRAAVNYRYSDGDRRDLLLGDRINGQDALAGRITLRFQPDDALDVLLKVHGNRIRNGVPNQKVIGVVPRPGRVPGPDENINPTTPTGANPITGYIDTPGPWTTRSGLDQFENIDVLGATLTVSRDFGAATLTSISAVIDADRQAQVDADASPFPLAHATFGSKSMQYTQDLRLASESGRFGWIVGASYLHEKLRIDNTNLLFFTNQARVASRQKTDSIAAFVDLSYEISDAVAVRAGGRYTHDRKAFSTSQFNPLAPASLMPFLPPPLLVEYDDEESWDALSGSAVIEYTGIERTLLYAKVAHAFRAGGFNTNLYFDPSSQVPVDPETVTSVEAGSKSDLLGRRLRLNTSLFYSWAKDLQVLLPSGIGQALRNAASARIKGAEIELEALPFDALRANLSVGLLDAEYDDFVLFPGGPNYKGQQLVYSPEVKLSGGFRYTQTLEAATQAFAAVDGSYQSKFYNNPENDIRSGGRGYFIWNAAVGIEEPDGRWSLSAFVRNASNKAYNLGGLNLSGFGFYQNRFGTPRTFGIALAYRFG